MIVDGWLTMASVHKHSQLAEKSVRVLICASSAANRAKLEQELHRQPGKQVVATVPNIAELRIATVGNDLDVIILCVDTRLSRIDWEELTALGVPIVFIAEGRDIESAASAISAGAQAVLVGNVTGTQLAGAISSAVSGLITLSSDLAELVRQGLVAEFKDEQGSDAVGAIPGDDGNPEHLTRREREVLEMMADGFSNKEIAAQLSISAHTVKFHISSILGKLGASSRTEAASIGLRRGLITI